MFLILELKNVSFSVAQKICFQNFSTKIYNNSKIGIIGKNGVGKSSLLKIIVGEINPSSGSLIRTKENYSYLPQIIDHEEFSNLSGGEKLNKVLSLAIANHPEILCLDEPTNHLDTTNKKSLLKFLQAFSNAIIIVSHDIDILKHCVSEIWEINDEKEIKIYAGNYDFYELTKKQTLSQRINQLNLLKKEEKIAIKKRILEQKRISSSKRANIHENDKILLGAMKEKGSKSIGKQQKLLNQTSTKITESLANLNQHKNIKPKFYLPSNEKIINKILISVSHGSCGYSKDLPILTKIDLSISATDRVWIQGNNGSGKSTLLKAILKSNNIFLSGDWDISPSVKIGYLDQTYKNLKPNKTVFDTIAQANPNWSSEEIRHHLNNFLFFTNKQTFTLTENLSGGEKARLSLAQISAQKSNLLLLDEITNNLDLETKKQVLTVLQNFPGCIILVSHDRNFAENINPSKIYTAHSCILEQKI